MASENPSRQQSADASQSSMTTGQQGTGAAQSRQTAQGSQMSGYGGGSAQQGRQGASQPRYGTPATRGAAGYGTSPYGGYAGGPFSLMQRISEEMDRLFESFGVGRNFFPEEMAQARGVRGQGASLWSPHLEVCERNGKLLIQVDLPGVRREDVNVQIEPDAVIIQGERTQQTERNEQGYYHSERSYGSFYRTVPLPEGIDTDQAEATFRDGVLEIEMPMPQQQGRARRLEVRDAGGTGTTYEGTGRSSGTQSGTTGTSASSTRASASTGGEHTSSGSR
jgi:HSP20 family protein